MSRRRRSPALRTIAHPVPIMDTIDTLQVIGPLVALATLAVSVLGIWITGPKVTGELRTSDLTVGVFVINNGNRAAKNVRLRIRPSLIPPPTEEPSKYRIPIVAERPNALCPSQ